MRPLGEALGASILMPLDVREPGELEAVFAAIAERWGRLDILLHSIAFAPKEDLHGRVVDAFATGFAPAMDVSVHSFLRMIRLAEPLMADGGSCLTVSFQGATRVVEHYNIMGPVKAAVEVGPSGIRVNALSPGPMMTRAASGIDAFDELRGEAAARAPTHRLATLDDVGAYAAFLASDGARNVTGVVHPIDGGYAIVD